MRRHLGVLSAVAVSALAALAQAQTIFTQWDFDAIGPVGPVDDSGLPTNAPYFSAGLIYNNPTPTTGNGIATPLGMTNNYVFATTPPTTGSVPNCDVTSAAGIGSQSTYSVGVWRVRGPLNVAGPPGNGNGWNRSAPERTQGAEFDASTVGYSGITFSCQAYCTTQGVSTGRTQYTLDGTTWIDFGNVIHMQSNDFLSPATGAISSTNTGIFIDFSSIPAANNNPNFGVRIVSVYDPFFVGTATVPAPSYGSAAGYLPPSTTNSVPYNNQSGNWRFGLVTFTGTASGPINPILRASSNVAAACSTVNNTVTFNVLVQPGINPASTGMHISANLSAFGLSANQAMTGNAAGTFFTYTGTIPANTITVVGAQVTQTATFTSTDDQGRHAVVSTPINFVNCSGTNANSTVVISQVYGGGGRTDLLNANNEGVYDSSFVEIYNRSANLVNLNGWSVQACGPSNASGFSTSNTQVNLSGTIQPHQYMLIRYTDPLHGFTPLPRPDFATFYGYGNLGNTGGRVALSDSTAPIGTAYTGTHVKDLVGYGVTAVTFEGAGPAPTPDNAHSVMRKSTASDSNEGAQDTNQNFNDFVVGFPTPHNRAFNGTTSFLTAYPSIPSSNPNVIVVTYGGCAGSTVLFTANVTPGTGSTGITVMADVSGITGTPGSVQLFDDGTHGDVTAGDGAYSLAYTIPANAPQGRDVVNFTVTDAEGGVANSSFNFDVGNCVDPGTGPTGAPVVFSTIFGGGAHNSYDPNRDFAQIYNRSDSPVDMTGWNIQYANLTDADFFPTKVIPLSGVIGPHETRIVSGALILGIGIPIPTPDYLPPADFGFDNQFARIAIVRPIPPATTAAMLHPAGSFVQDGRGVVDLVGYGALTATYEGVAPTDTLANGTWAVRKQNGNQDFNQNIIDFDIEYILSIPRSTRTLTVVKTGTGTATGTVTSDIGGITCGAVCSGIIDRDAVVTLTAVPAPRSKFMGWSGGGTSCPGTSPCTLTLTDSATVTASFGCLADFNNMNGITVQDIFDFLTAWFAGDPRADINGSGGITVQDIFDFLSAWFAGC